MLRRCVYRITQLGLRAAVQEVSPQLSSGQGTHWVCTSRQTCQQQAAALLRSTGYELRLCRGFAAEAAAGSSTRGSGKKSPITFNSMLLGAGIFLAVVAVAQNNAQKKVEGMMQRSQEVVGKAAVGGPFSLTDQNGKPFTNKNLEGQFNILYFGFTHCPDICPDELEKLAVALDLIEKQQNYQVSEQEVTWAPGSLHVVAAGRACCLEAQRPGCTSQCVCCQVCICMLELHVQLLVCKWQQWQQWLAEVWLQCGCHVDAHSLGSLSTQLCAAATIISHQHQLLLSFSRRLSTPAHLQ